MYIEECGENEDWSCTIFYRLPIDGPSGDPLYAEAAITGRKKEAVLECAKEACRMLDAAGLLRQSSHGSGPLYIWISQINWWLILIIIRNDMFHLSLLSQFQVGDGLY